jgi:hypothetical protein
MQIRKQILQIKVILEKKRITIDQFGDLMID